MATTERIFAEKLATFPMLTAGVNLFAIPPQPYGLKSYNNSEAGWDYCVNVFSSGGFVQPVFGDKSVTPDMELIQVVIRSKDDSYSTGKKIVTKIERMIDSAEFSELGTVALTNKLNYGGKTRDDHHFWSLNIRVHRCRPSLPHFYGFAPLGADETTDILTLNEIKTNSIMVEISETVTEKVVILAVPQIYSGDADAYVDNARIAWIVVGSKEISGVNYDFLVSDLSFSGPITLSIY